MPESVVHEHSSSDSTDRGADPHDVDDRPGPQPRVLEAGGIAVGDEIKISLDLELVKQ